METSESLSIESFSYSWLVNLKPSFESPKGSFRDSFDESSFIEMDPKLSASQRFIVFHQDFNFDRPRLQPCVHADELISNGILVPLFLKPLDVGIYDSSSDSNSSPIVPMSSTTLEKSRSLERSFRRYKRLPKRVVQKYLNLVRLIWLRMRRGRCDAQRTKNWEFSGTIEACGSDTSWVLESPKSCTSSPRITDTDNWRRSCDSESSIYEAVLHCKKTIGCK